MHIIWNRNLRHIQARDVGVARPDPDSLEELIDQSLFADSYNFNFTGRKIFGVPIKPQSACLTMDEIPKSDALNKTADNNSNCASWHAAPA